MASKWADYLISAVRYNAAETHITVVRCHPDNGDSVGSASERARERVVALLDGGTTFMTIYQNPDDTTKWKKGAEVRVVTIDGTKYIRTDADRIKADNLGDLPRF
jgi:hypothetical protein